jgi:hypothetical protein
MVMIAGGKVRRWSRVSTQALVLVFFVGLVALWSAVSLLFYFEIQ